MRIKTKPYSLSREQFFKIVLLDFVTRQWWGYLLMAVILVIGAIIQGQRLVSILAIIVVGCVLLLGLPYFSLQRFVNAPDNQRFMQPRRFEMDANALYFTTTDGRRDQVNFEDVTRAHKTGTYYIFYIGRSFHVVPFSAFYTAEDMGQVDAVLRFRKYIGD